jgi:hypothetical protein
MKEDYTLNVWPTSRNDKNYFNFKLSLKMKIITTVVSWGEFLTMATAFQKLLLKYESIRMWFLFKFKDE